MDANEDIADAVVREVLEETNVRVKFRSLATMRETHRGPFKGTPVYVAACVLENPDMIPVPRPQDSEIANANGFRLKHFWKSFLSKRIVRRCA